MLKKTLMIFAIIFVLSSTVVFAASENGIGAVIDADVLNVRSAPSTSSEIIGKFYAGDKLNIITRTSGEWYKINYNGTIGYVYAEYISAARNGEPAVRSRANTYAAPQSAEGSTKGEQVVNTAKQFLGVPYVYGGTSPAGFDCSGLVQYVYKLMGVSLNRVACDQTAHGTPVTRAGLMPGDIVFFHNVSKYTRINHVGIYVGNGQFIHAPTTGDVVKISSLDTGYYNTTFVTARRIFN